MKRFSWGDIVIWVAEERKNREQPGDSLETNWLAAVGRLVDRLDDLDRLPGLRRVEWVLTLVRPFTSLAGLEVSLAQYPTSLDSSVFIAITGEPPVLELEFADLQHCLSRPLVVGLVGVSLR